MTRIAGSLAVELELSDAKMRGQYRNLIDELKRSVVPISVAPTVTTPGGAAVAGGIGSSSFTSAGAAFAAATRAPGVTSSAYSYTPAAAAFQGYTPGGPPPAAMATGFAAAALYQGPNAFPPQAWSALNPGASGVGAWTSFVGPPGGGGGGRAAAGGGLFGRSNAWLQANTGSLFRYIAPLFTIREGLQALRTFGETEDAAALARTPLEALAARSQGIDRMTSGLLGAPLGFLADLTGYGPASVRRALQYETARFQTLESGRQGARRVAEGQATRAAFAAGGTTAADVARRRFAVEAQVGALEEESGSAAFRIAQIEGRSGFWSTLADAATGRLFGLAAGPEERAQVTALRTRRRGIAQEVRNARQQGAFEEELATFEGEQRRAGLIASRNRWRDVEAGTPTYAVERRSATAQHEIERRELVKFRPEDVPAFDEDFGAQTAAEDAVRARSLARDFRLAGAGALSSRLRIARQPLRARLNEILAQGEFDAMAEGIDPQQAWLIRQRASGQWYETYLTAARDRSDRIADLQGDTAALRALAGGDRDEFERQNKLTEFVQRMRAIGDDPTAEGERRAELDRQTAEWAVLRKNQADRRRFRREGLAIAEEASGLEADRQPYTADVRSIARTARLRDREAEAGGFDRDERALMLADAINRLGSLRERLTRGVAVAGNPALADFSGTDSSSKDVVKALGEIKREIERLNHLMEDL